MNSRQGNATKWTRLHENAITQKLTQTWLQLGESVELVEKANRLTASGFLVALIDAVPYKIHTVLTDNGILFHFAPRYADGLAARYMTLMFDMRYRENGIERRFTKVNHPWINGPVERMNQTTKEATVKRFHYDSHDHLRQHLKDFISAYNFERRLKTLKWLTPYEFICKKWTYIILASFNYEC